MAVTRLVPRHAWPLFAVALAGLLTGLFGYLRADPSPAADRFYLRSAGGAVLFRHVEHQRRGVACARCHHEAPAAAARNCRGCHPAEAGEGSQEIRTLADAYHSCCNGCHLAEAPARFADAAGEPSCHACHLK